MIDTENEQLITLADATKILPGRPNITTIWRWRNRGCRGVKLETVLSDGRRFTSVEALHRFQERVTNVADGQPVEARTPRQRERDVARAEKELAQAGW